ncbi:MAG: cytochrome c peroxidase, partial [Ferruginibacter sp.]
MATLPNKDFINLQSVKVNMYFRKKTYVVFCLIALVGFTSFYSFQQNATDGSDIVLLPDLPAVPYNYSHQPLPGYFYLATVSDQENTPDANKISDWGATLGRVLFYDKALSINNGISCAGCHKQELSFSDDKAMSAGFAGGSTKRNSMPLVNVRYYAFGRFFWDQRAPTLEHLSLKPVQDNIEMGMRLDSLEARIKQKDYYPGLFKKAFGTPLIDRKRIAEALAQFVSSIVSYRSKFDSGRAAIATSQDPFQTPYRNFTTLENQGKKLFFSARLACGACHGTETFTAPAPRNNGIENPSVDEGIGAIDNIQQEIGDFKYPSLKNIELTAPYMHDG